MIILLLEPDERQANAIAKFLKHDVLIAYSAKQLFATLDNQKVDLLITEHQIGEHNSLDILQEVRSYEDLKDLPIIMLTSSHIDSSIIKSKSFVRLNVGVYIYKPKTRLADLAVVVDRFLGSPNE